MTDLFTASEQRKREKQLEELITHQRLLLSKALKLMKGHGIIENTVRKEIRETIKRTA